MGDLDAPSLKWRHWVCPAVPILFYVFRTCALLQSSTCAEGLHLLFPSVAVDFTFPIPFILFQDLNVGPSGALKAGVPGEPLARKRVRVRTKQSVVRQIGPQVCAGSHKAERG